MLKNRLATGIHKVPEQMLEEVWITKWWQTKRCFHRGKCTAVLLMPQKTVKKKRSPSNKRFRSRTFVNEEYVRGLLTNTCMLRWLKVSKQTFTSFPRTPDLGNVVMTSSTPQSAELIPSFSTVAWR
jgi:hypothetical protein